MGNIDIAMSEKATSLFVALLISIKEISIQDMQMCQVTTGRSSSALCAAASSTFTSSVVATTHLVFTVAAQGIILSPLWMGQLDCQPCTMQGLLIFTQCKSTQPSPAVVLMGKIRCHPPLLQPEASAVFST